MKKNLLMALVFGISMMCAGCASTIQYVKFPDQNKVVEDSSKARIYVLRPATVASAIPMSITDQDIVIGQTGPQGYLCWEREPGKTTIIGKAENKSMLEVDVVPNTVYYIQQKPRPGFLFAGNKLVLLPKEKAEKFLKKCKEPIFENTK